MPPQSHHQSNEQIVQDLLNRMKSGLGPIIVVGLVLFVVLLFTSAATYVIEPGTRGVKVTLGKTETNFLSEGFGLRLPMLTRIVPIKVKQRTAPLNADCFSSDLQQLTLDVRVLYRIPEETVVQIYKQYAGDPFDTLVAPRVQEALKEVTALKTAEQIVKDREKIKQSAITAARQKIGALLVVEDIVIRNIELSAQLERAIEAKMVAEQEAAKARFTQLQTEIEAQTVIIRAKGEADAIRVRGEALKLNPAFLRLQIVEKWNGTSPIVVPSGDGPRLLLPLGDAEPVAP